MDERKKSVGSIVIDVDTSQLDEAIHKTRVLVQLLERVDGLTYRIKKDMNEIGKNHIPPTL